MKIGKVQIIITALAIAAGIFAVLVFAGVIPGLNNSSSKNKISLTMWGTISGKAMQPTLLDLKGSAYNIEISYTEKNPATFESEFVDALARQSGPDIVIFPSEMILPEQNKLKAIPFETVGERIFRDTFADGTELLLTEKGVLGLPILIDPMVVFWNKDIFRNKSIADSPKTWNEFLTTSQTLTELGSDGNISRAGSALGIETNVNHFKEIISILILQTGSPIIDSKTFRFDSGGMRDALRFFIEFSDPQKFSYSWAKSMPKSQDAFLKESLAMYFAFGSEYPSIKEKNPHLNFDISEVPQILNGKLSLTYGKFYSLGIVNQTKNYAGALRAIQAIASKEEVRKISELSFMAPARRDLLREGTKSAPLQTNFTQAIKFRSWLDINYEKTNEIFANMVKSVYTRVKTEDQATRDAKDQLDVLYSW